MTLTHCLHFCQAASEDDGADYSRLKRYKKAFKLLNSPSARQSINRLKVGWGVGEFEAQWCGADCFACGCQPYYCVPSRLDCRSCWIAAELLLVSMPHTPHTISDMKCTAQAPSTHALPAPGPLPPSLLAVPAAVGAGLPGGGARGLLHHLPDCAQLLAVLHREPGQGWHGGQGVGVGRWGGWVGRVGGAWWAGF